MNKTTLVAEPGKHEILVTRILDAPRELVYNAYTDPESIPQWWGPKGLTTVVDKLETKAGGIWRFVQHDADGNEYGFHGVFHELVAPERLVYTFEWEGLPGHVLMETLRFEDVNGKTNVFDSSVFQSVEDRDGMLMAGMEGGASESMDRLDELLAKARMRG